MMIGSSVNTVDFSGGMILQLQYIIVYNDSVREIEHSEKHMARTTDQNVNRALVM